MATVAISRRAVERLRAGAVWVYRSDVERVAEDVEAGAIVTVVDGRGVEWGSAIYSSASQIPLRMVSGVAGLSRERYLEDLAARVGAAVELRERLAPVTEADNAHRLIFSEADELPGIVADRYNDVVILQLLTQATAREDVRAAVARELKARLAGVATIVERPDPRIRVAEELAMPAAEPLFADRDDAKLATVFTINGLKFRFDAEAGQKTGAFLDQRLNYAAAARVARLAKASEALDICTYQGGFALHLAEVCERVTGVDASRAALEVADGNLELNPRLAAKVDWIEADAFELLREFEAAGRKFDAIVLDPPAFAKSKRALEGALRGYKEMNLRALKMIRPGGTLVTCSCSQHVAAAEFSAVVAATAVDARRRVQVLEMRGAAPDHPAIVTLPETGYLKCMVCRVG
jgi:23S rRNA (cytosine1962-C5)-methyltransferase